MFIALNRFQVYRGREYDFERRWKQREASLHAMPGFVGFTLLRNWLGDDTTEYISHSSWRSREDFDAWRAGHIHTDYVRGGLGSILACNPELSLYETVADKAELVTA
jgi:heme-degrading monooxygenase HmoA